MSATDVEAKIYAEDLTRAKDMVKGIVRDWNWFTWNDLLADDVTLSIKLGSIGVTNLGGRWRFRYFILSGHPGTFQVRKFPIPCQRYVGRTMPLY